MQFCPCSKGTEPEHDRGVRRVSEHVQLSDSPHLSGTLLSGDQPAQGQSDSLRQVSATVRDF